MENTAENRLIQAILSLTSEVECRAFLHDLLTARELEELSGRLEVATLLQRKCNYNDIVAQTGASTATISRVSKCLAGEEGGYRAVLEKLGEVGGSKLTLPDGLGAEERAILLRLAKLLTAK